MISGDNLAIPPSCLSSIQFLAIFDLALYCIKRSSGN